MPKSVADGIARGVLYLGAATAVLYLVMFGLSAYVYLHNRTVNMKQSDVIALLCNRSYNLAPIVDDVVLGALAIVESRLVDDIKAGRMDAVAADREFIRRLTEDHIQLNDQLLNPATPCAKTP